MSEEITPGPISVDFAAAAEGKTAEQQKPSLVVEMDRLTQETVTVSPALIINALKCIDAAAQRGTYQGGELSAVGGVRDALYSKVSTIVEALDKQAKAEAAAKKG